MKLTVIHIIVSGVALLIAAAIVMRTRRLSQADQLSVGRREIRDLLTALFVSAGVFNILLAVAAYIEQS